VDVNGSVSHLVVTGIPRVTVKAVVAKANIVGASKVNVDTGGKFANVYVDAGFADVAWKSNIANGNVYMYSGRFDLKDAEVSYSSDGLYVYGNTTIDTRTGFGGFNSPTVFKWFGGPRTRWLIDEGQIVTPS
tara:strand:- start:154 stop:549 length:396 start_codon:yes stop_codon:yes gene_type:complete